MQGTSEAELLDAAEGMLRGARPAGFITRLMVRSAGRSCGTAPKGARTSFTADCLGSTGWELVLPEGTVEELHVAVSDSSFRSHRFKFADQGASEGRSIGVIIRTYVTHLTEMVRGEREYFA